MRCSGMFGREKIPEERRYQKREDTRSEKILNQETIYLQNHLCPRKSKHFLH